MTDQHLKRLEEENRELIRAVEELSILNDLARSIGASLNSQEIIQTIVRRSLRALDAEQGVITLVEKREETSMKTLIRAATSSVDLQKYHFNQSLLGWMDIHQEPLLISDPKNDPRFQGVEWDPSIRSLLSVPLIVKSEMVGVLTVYNKKHSESFSSDDQRLLAIIASQSAQVIENARLYEEEKALLFLQKEMELASKIQIDLLPKFPPQIDGYEFSGKSIPAATVGGDYFDYFPLDDDRVGFIVGDAAGKGMPAAIFMAVGRTLLRAESLRTRSVGECMNNVNKALNIENTTSMFITMIYGILNSKSAEIEYCNAGHHNPIILRCNGTLEELKNSKCMAIGMMDDTKYESSAVKLDHGDTFILYTDGITEAINNSQIQFGEKSLFAAINKNVALTAEEHIDALLKSVITHVGKTQQFDDMTLLVIRRK